MSTINSAANSELNLLISKIESQIADLKNVRPNEGSMEFYLLNNLAKYRQSLASAESKQDVKNAASIFSRFCTESMDWETKGYQHYIELSEEGFSLARHFDKETVRSV